MGKEDIKCCERDKNKPPPAGRACGVCPKCTATCSVDPPPTAAELEVKLLAVKLEQTQNSFKYKINECALLRADVQRCKEEADRERAAARGTVARLRELEQRFDALGEHARALLRHKEQTVGQATAARALKQCYREARDEAAELRALLADQGVQLQDYRAKAQQAAQLVEEQKKQMAALDLDNTRIADQVNLEIQSIKVKFRERLQELAPLPGRLAEARRRLQAALQAAALAQHAAVRTGRDLDGVREQVNTLLARARLAPGARPARRGNEDKLLALTQQRVTQLTEMNASLKGEIERQKSNAVRLEEATAACERRLQEKMHECAALGGELDRAREDAGGAVARARQREDTVRKCTETTADDMRAQLRGLRAQLDVAEKERQSMHCRMQCQVQRLQHAVQAAETRARGLEAQAAALRQGEADDAAGLDAPGCGCGIRE